MAPRAISELGSVLKSSFGPGKKKAAAGSAPSSVPVSGLKLAEAVKAIGKYFQMTLS